jgi:hypothetical protein
MDPKRRVKIRILLEFVHVINAEIPSERLLQQAFVRDMSDLIIFECNALLIIFNGGNVMATLDCTGVQDNTVKKMKDRHFGDAPRAHISKDDSLALAGGSFPRVISNEPLRLL